MPPRQYRLLFENTQVDLDMTLQISQHNKPARLLFSQAKFILNIVFFAQRYIFYYFV